jgi:cell division protein FtsQ
MMISQVWKCYKGFKFSWKWMTNLLCFLTFLCFITFATHQFKTANYFPIKEVKIIGVQRTDPHEVQRLLTPLVKKGFFTVNIDVIKDCLIQFPWIAEASVRRVWPNQIFIHLAEKSSAARWNDNKLLSASGQIFSPTKESYPTGLPQFIGPEGEHLRMLQYYVSMQHLLMPLHFTIARFQLTSAGTWSLILNNGIKLNIGHKDVLTRVGDFVKVYPKIIGNKASNVDYVDLRYPSGLAVRWRTIT